MNRRVEAVVLLLGVIVLCAVTPQLRRPQAQTHTDTPPASTRSLEKIDHWNAISEADVYLFRIMTCYYIVVLGTHPAVVHLASCPSPEHRKPLPTGVDNSVHPGDPIIGRPLGGIPEFSGVILEDELKRRKDK